MCNCYRKGFVVTNYNWNEAKGKISVNVKCHNCDTDQVFVIDYTDENLCRLINQDIRWIADYIGA